MKTHYEILDIDGAAEHKTVQAAYYAAARKWHPDNHSQSSTSDAAKADEAMRRVNEAWAILGDSGKRASYDERLLSQTVRGASERVAHTDHDGITRIDPRLLNRDYLNERRAAQQEQISNGHSRALRVLPGLAIVGALALVFIFSAYAGNDEGPAPDPAGGPPLGAGIEVGDCIDVTTGPALIPRPCTATADGRVVGSRFLDSGSCPLETTEQLALANGRVVCLGPLIGTE